MLAHEHRLPKHARKERESKRYIKPSPIDYARLRSKVPD
jgi:hypothetical protein